MQGIAGLLEAPWADIHIWCIVFYKVVFVVSQHDWTILCSRLVILILFNTKHLERPTSLVRVTHNSCLYIYIYWAVTRDLCVWGEMWCDVLAIHDGPCWCDGQSQLLIEGAETHGHGCPLRVQRGEESISDVNFFIPWTNQDLGVLVIFWFGLSIRLQISCVRIFSNGIKKKVIIPVWACFWNKMFHTCT